MMRLKKILCALAVAALGVSAADVEPQNVGATFQVRDIVLPEQYAKGNNNLKPVNAIDDAAWIWSARTEAKYVRFSRAFASDGKPLRIHVSADNRYTLYVDAQRIGRGPDRGLVRRWTFRTYELDLQPGNHVLEAVVVHDTVNAPLAQLSAGKGGFILKAEGEAYDRLLTTGKADWRARIFGNVACRDPGNGSFGVGRTVFIDGDSPWTDAREGEEPTVVVRGPVGAGSDWGSDFADWYLYPSSLPAQLDEVRRPGHVVAVAEGVVSSDYSWRAADRDHPAIARFNRHLADGTPVEIPSNTAWSVLWDLGDYYCAYPEASVSSGAGSEMSWGWAESLARSAKAAAYGALDKGNRGEFVGKVFAGYADASRFRGGGAGEGFTTPWWRCGRWCLLTFRTGAVPLVIGRLAIDETRYPIDKTAAFESDDATLGPVQRICERGLEMNSHEMGFDCPYYEQQMYGGDSRIQFLTHHVLHADDRLVRRNVDLFDWSRRDDGRIGMNTPTRGTQDSTSFSFMWPMMLADYSLWRTNATWLAQKMPGLLHTMQGFRNFEREDGLLQDLPGWNFIDWTSWSGGRAHFGEPKDVDRLSGILNLFYLYSLKSAATVCETMGETEFAAAYRRRFARTADAYVKTFWCEQEGLLSDTDTLDSFSQHSQALAIVLGVLPPQKDARIRSALVGRTDLVPATVSFKHYVFEAFAKMGRGDLILRELDLWRSYVAKDLKTGQEMPDPTRSDCHGWSSHPLYALHAEIAGVTPAAPFFEKVRVAPCPGPLAFIRSVTPTPRGDVSVDLRFAEGRASGKVTLPPGLSGTFEFGSARMELVSGVNDI